MPGNINLHDRPVVHNRDGSISTVRSMSFGTDRGEVLIPTVVGGRVVSDTQAVEHYRQTGEHLGIFRTPAAATAYAQSLHNDQAREYLPRSGGAPNATPVQNGAAVIRTLFPNARVTSGYRSPSSALGRANPNSWHNRGSDGHSPAVDVAPIHGTTFGQYIGRIRDSGYNIIEARDEQANPLPWTTGPNWHVVIGQ